MKVIVGNRDAIQVADDGSRTSLTGNTYTEMLFDDSVDPTYVMRNITDPDGIWANHAQPGSTPAWVASDDQAVAELLSTMWGGIEVRELDEPATDSSLSKTAVVLRAATTAALMLLPARMLMMLMVMTAMTPELKTSAGNDFQAKQMAGAASATAVAKWMALTANTTTPVIGDTTLTAEIVTAGGGLLRYAATYAHTGAATTYTLTGTFTANGSDALPVTIGKMGVFDAASTGNLVFATLVSPTATLSASGDVLTITQTVTM